MAKGSSQKFTQRNRPARVEIEYEVELFGAEKVINLPFVMGVMADLSGKNSSELPAVGDRDFTNIDMDNFESFLKSQKPRVAFRVPNTLTGEGELSVDLTFESMDDFSPAAVARKVEALNELLTAREQLANLLDNMDGKSNAEALIQKMLQDHSLLENLASLPKSQGDAATDDTPTDDTTQEQSDD